MNTKLVAALHTKRASQGGHGGQSRGCRASAGAGATTPTRGTPTGTTAAIRTYKQDLEPPIHYCLTCVPGCRHNSAKCPAPATSHVYTSTKRDMQGEAEAKK